MCTDHPSVDPNTAQNNNTARYISADEIANGARAFSDAAQTNRMNRRAAAPRPVGFTNSETHTMIEKPMTTRTTVGEENTSKTDHRPG